MARIDLLDEINRLFDEMVRDPWTRPTRRQPPQRPVKERQESHLEVDLPIGERGKGDVSVAIQGNRLTVSVGRGSAAGRASEKREAIERSFVLPEGADVTRVEAHFEGDVLHVRIGLGHKKS